MPPLSENYINYKQVSHASVLARDRCYSLRHDGSYIMGRRCVRHALTSHIFPHLRHVTSHDAARRLADFVGAGRVLAIPLSYGIVSLLRGLQHYA